jgi:hypothetical protein
MQPPHRGVQAVKCEAACHHSVGMVVGWLTATALRLTLSCIRAIVIRCPHFFTEYMTWTSKYGDGLQSRKQCLGPNTDDRSTVNTCALDLSKAFYRIDHNGLYIKAQANEAANTYRNTSSNRTSNRCLWAIKQLNMNHTGRNPMVLGMSKQNWQHAVAKQPVIHRLGQA